MKFPRRKRKCRKTRRRRDFERGKWSLFSYAISCRHDEVQENKGSILVPRNCNVVSK